MTRRVRGLVATLGALLAVGAAAAACGVPTTGTARVIPPPRVPFDLLSPTPPTTTSTTQTGYVQATVYFIDSTHQIMVPEQRYVPPPKSLTAVLDVLLAGPTLSELTSGIESALNGEVHLLDTHVANGVAVIDFNSFFGELSGISQVFGVAQVVYTVAGELRRTTGIEFEIDGIPIDVPVATGALVPGPVRESQYTALAPLPSTTTPGTPSTTTPSSTTTPGTPSTTTPSSTTTTAAP